MIIKFEIIESKFWGLLWKVDDYCYSYLHNITNSRARVGSLKNAEGDLVSDSQTMCNILSNFFTSVFTDEDTTNIPIPYCGNF